MVISSIMGVGVAVIGGVVVIVGVEVMVPLTVGVAVIVPLTVGVPVTAVELAAGVGVAVGWFAKEGRTMVIRTATKTLTATPAAAAMQIKILTRTLMLITRASLNS
jgi:hypothetical protein